MTRPRAEPSTAPAVVSAVAPTPVNVLLGGPFATVEEYAVKLFEQAGIEVGRDGAIAGGFATPNPTTRALYELRSRQTFADQKRGTLDAMAYAASLGISDRVRMLGWRRDLAAIYAATDVFLLTSRNEGTPVALIEAMASGVPGVSTDVGGVKDVIHASLMPWM